MVLRCDGVDVLLIVLLWCFSVTSFDVCCVVVNVMCVSVCFVLVLC